MGCAICKEGTNGPSDDPYNTNEKSHLLDHDHSSISAIRPIDNGNHSTLSSITKTDEQSLLSRILHQTAQNIIDVSAIEPHSMERNEYIDKIKHYQEKTLKGDFNLPKGKLQSVTDNPCAVLSAECVCREDVAMMLEKSRLFSEALQRVSIACQDDIVASIGVDKPLVTLAV